jgi:hypothetical protein
MDVLGLGGTSASYPGLRTLGDVTDCPKPWGKLPLVLGQSAEPKVSCIAKL